MHVFTNQCLKRKTISDTVVLPILRLSIPFYVNNIRILRRISNDDSQHCSFYISFAFYSIFFVVFFYCILPLRSFDSNATHIAKVEDWKNWELRATFLPVQFFFYQHWGLSVIGYYFLVYPFQCLYTQASCIIFKRI